MYDVALEMLPKCNTDVFFLEHANMFVCFFSSGTSTAEVVCPAVQMVIIQTDKSSIKACAIRGSFMWKMQRP